MNPWSFKKKAEPLLQLLPRSRASSVAAVIAVDEQVKVEASTTSLKYWLMSACKKRPLPFIKPEFDVTDTSVAVTLERVS